MLSDLRESGAIEQDADIVMFLYRPEYYGLFEDDNDFNVKGLTEVIIAKHRNGPLDTAYIKFINKYVKFVDTSKRDVWFKKLSVESFTKTFTFSYAEQTFYKKFDKKIIKNNNLLLLKKLFKY